MRRQADGQNEQRGEAGEQDVELGEVQPVRDEAGRDDEDHRGDDADDRDRGRGERKPDEPDEETRRRGRIRSRGFQRILRGIPFGVLGIHSAFVVQEDDQRERLSTFAIDVFYILERVVLGTTWVRPAERIFGTCEQARFPSDASVCCLRGAVRGANRRDVDELVRSMVRERRTRCGVE